MNTWKRTGSTWQDGINLILGLWLIVSPWVLGFAMTRMAMGNAVIFGIVMAVLAIAALANFRSWEEWVDMIVGVWLIVSPWVLRFAFTARGAEGGHYAATWNFVIVGIVTIILAAWSLREHHPHAPA